MGVSQALFHRAVPSACILSFIRCRADSSLKATDTTPSHEDGDMLCHGQWTVWPATEAASYYLTASRRKSWVRKEERRGLVQLHCRQHEFHTGLLGVSVVLVCSLLLWENTWMAKGSWREKGLILAPIPRIYSPSYEGSPDSRSQAAGHTNIHHQEAERVR